MALVADHLIFSIDCHIRENSAAHVASIAVSWDVYPVWVDALGPFVVIEGDIADLAVKKVFLPFILFSSLYVQLKGGLAEGAYKYFLYLEMKKQILLFEMEKSCHFKMEKMLLFQFFI